MEKLLKFLKSQKLMAVASCGEKDVWVANVYIGVDEKMKIYFVSADGTKHSQMILKNPSVAFSVAWFDGANHKNRKAVQGIGVCRPAKDKKEIITGVKLHNQNFPEFKERITIEWIQNNKCGSRVWVLIPTYIKHWNDELYGEDGSKEFVLK